MMRHPIFLLVISPIICSISALQPENNQELNLLKNRILQVSTSLRQNYLNLKVQDIDQQPAGLPPILNSKPIANPDKRAQVVENIYTTISTGKLKGSLVETNRSRLANIYLGVPYAQIPTGKLRFKEPKPALAWTGTYDATYYRAACPQNASFPTTEGWMDEDCLQLNLFLPPSCTSKYPCPIIYYIHGGQYTYDTPVAFPIDALVDNFAARGVAMITVGMRLGNFGFWTTGNEQALGNWGIYDAMLGLEWVHKEGPMLNLDTSRISIMGHSSGSDIVSFLAISPKTEGLFHQIIEMSGSPMSYSGIDRGAGVQRSQQLANEVGCSSGDKPWSPDHDLSSVVDCMQALDWQTILDAQKQLELQGFAPLAVRIDGPAGLFSADPESLAQTRRPYPMLIGSVMHESDGIGLAFAGDSAAQSLVNALCSTGVTTFVHTTYPSLLTTACISAYANSNLTISEQAGEIINDEFIFVPTFKDASSMTQAGGQVYLYSFDYVKAGLEGIAPWHAMDLTYVMGLHPFEFDDRDQAIQDIYVDLFANFAKTSNPTPAASLSKDQEGWKPMRVSDFNYYSVDLPEPKNKADYHRVGIEIWTEIIPNLDNKLKSNSAGGAPIFYNNVDLTNMTLQNTTSNTNDSLTITKTSLKTEIDFETAFFICLVAALCLLMALVIWAALNTCQKRNAKAQKKRRKTLQPSEKTHLLSGATSDNDTKFIV